MTLFQFWYNLDTPIPIALIFYKEDEYESEWQYLDESWTWEGTPEELYSEFQERMYALEVIEIQKEKENGYTIWITNRR